MPDKGFISYAHDDYELFEAFQIHLRATELRWGIKFWADPDIHAGYRWNPEIQQRIEEAHLFILLVSPEFIASDFIYKTELPAIDTRCTAVKGLIMPVILRNSAWGMLAGVFQAVPTDRGKLKPVTKWRPRSDGLDCAREQIDRAISHHYGVPLPSRAWGAP